MGRDFDDRDGGTGGRSRRLAAVAIVVAAGLIAAVSAAALDGGTDDERIVATAAPATTAEAPQTSSPPPTTVEPTATTTAPAPSTTTTTAAPPRPTTTTTTVDSTRLDDWTHVRIASPRGFNISIGETIRFEFTMYNDGPWPIRVSGGCPWLVASPGAAVDCDLPVATRLDPGTSQLGVATFYARHIAGAPGVASTDADAWRPAAPGLYYLFDKRVRFPMGSPGRTSMGLVGIDVLDRQARLTVATEPTVLTLTPGAETALTVTVRNDTPFRIWDWGCTELSGPWSVRPSDMVAAAASEEPLLYDPALDPYRWLPDCVATAQWRAPGWTETFTFSVRALDSDTQLPLAPGDYTYGFGPRNTTRIPLTVAEAG